MRIGEIKKVAEERGLSLAVGAVLNLGCRCIREEKPWLVDTLLCMRKGY